MKELENLLSIMAALRDPETGCPWDQEQSFATIAPYTLEEAYEVQDCIQRQDFTELKHELGDLLFQVVYHSRMAEEEGLFDFRQVAESVCDKMLRRHPHVFGDETISSAREQEQAWEKIKQQEKKSTNNKDGILDAVLINQPALKRADKLQGKAANVGFDWQEITPVIEKIREELDEVLVEVEQQKSELAIREELGDLLFACVNLCRHLQVDAEFALGLTNEKFTRRFRFIERQVKDSNRDFKDLTLNELDEIWERAKVDETKV